MAVVNTHDTLEGLHMDRTVAASLPAWLALADRVDARLRASVTVQDAYSRAEDVTMLTTYGDDELDARFPWRSLFGELGQIEHKGVRALTVLAELDLLVDCPDLLAMLIQRTRDHLRAALLAGVDIEER